MLKVPATVSAIFEGLQALGCTILEEDVNAIEALVLMLEESSVVELSNANGMIFMSFDLDIRADTKALAAFVKTEEALNFNVFVNDVPSVFNPAFNNVILKKVPAMSNNKPASTLDLQAQLTQAIAASNAATSEACKVTSAFVQAIENAKAIAEQTLKNNEANEAAMKAAIESMTEKTAEATEKLNAATAQATKAASDSADRAAAMADAVNAQRQAAAQADAGPAWYTTTPAKAVGAAAVVAAVAAAGYYGWKAYSAK